MQNSGVVTYCLGLTSTNPCKDPITKRQTRKHTLSAQVYGVIGIFGAARYGDKTQGNILVNRWLGGPAEGILDLAIAAYLSISVPPMQVACYPS